ncbi:ATP-binding protein [Sphingomonas solaris]|uniref:histidine kinase n=1 Tax=Alterirhizorhabdus solaris TaxID=2529389 RepID=A0A558RAI5_9SPHN|nr:ATP-binding protein [Sphingomonas solaris]TVV76302.1 response regulator [Sphingomonas solaris]
MSQDSADTLSDGASPGAWQRRLASIAALIAAVLLIALVVLVAISNMERDKALLRERHSYDVMLVPRQLDTSIARAEAALGRFVISGEKQTGALYFDEWKKAGRQLDRLADLTRDNPAQAPLVRDLRHLYRERGVELARPATRTFSRQGWTALSMYYEAGKAGSIARIDTLMARIAANERDLLDARADRAALSVDRANYLTALLSGIGLLLVLCAAALGWTTVQALAQRARARLDARTESARARALEQAVAARTQELREANDRLRGEAETREAAEAQLRQVQKMEAVGQLTGGIAHDFNNMLAVVIGGLDLARRRLEHEAGEVGRHLDNAMEGAIRAAALTRRLLAFARAEPLLPEGVEPGALIAGMSDLIDRTLGERIAVKTSAAPGGWHVWCDPHQLENAILNLAVNARDAMHEEGRLTIATTNVTLGDGDIGEARAGDYVRVAVVDSGTGMTPEVLARVFEPFFTTKPPGKGTGLGLSQIFGFARQSEGEVAIDSTPGAGTTVSLYLPRFVPQARAQTSGVVTPIVPLARAAAGAVILVVEDDPRVRQATVGGLRELGYVPLPCASGAEAIALLDTRDEIALIVTDVVMPGMTGPELIAAVADRHGALPVLYVTGYVGEAADATGFAGYEVLRKPFTVAALDRAVAGALSGRHPPRSRAANE